MIKKKYGQNFISEKNLIKKIINLIDKESDLVIEIGAGRGALTKELKENFDKVIAFEIDRDLDIYLKNLEGDNLSVIYDDILNVNLKDLVKNYKKVSVISNTPYYLSSKIIFLLFDLSETKKLIKSVLMVQKEVAKRICAKKGETNYNNISIASELYANVKYEFTVNRNMFFPVPKVDSSIISYSYNESKYSNINKKEFIEITRFLFNNKRKTIGNNLKKLNLNYKEILIASGIDLNLRPQNLSIDEFIKIYKELKNANYKS